MKNCARDPKKDVCIELAELLNGNGGVRTLRLLQLSGILSPTIPRARPVSTATVESGVEMAGPRPISLWEPKEIDGELAFVRPAPSILGDHASARRIYRRKKPGTSRICLFGESVAAGYLYAPALTPAAVLEQQLATLCGGDGFDVIDLARTNESLRRMLATLESALQLEPDILVIFVGNNWNLLETRFLSPYVPSVQARQQFAQALRQGGVHGPIEVARQMLEREVTGAFTRLAEIARSAGIPVLCVLPEVNRADWENRQPVVWLPEDRTSRWHDSYRRALRCLETGDFKTAIQAATEMVELDGGTCPTPHRILYKAFLGLGEIEKANHASIAEIDSTHYANLCHLSAPQAMTLARKLLWEGAEKHGFSRVDLRPIFAEYTGSLLPGRRLFLDYCHLTSEGMKLAMAVVTAQVLHLAGRADLGWREVVTQVPDPEITSEAEGIARLGAAIHNAHRQLTVSPKTAIIEHWCEQALAAAPEPVTRAMVDFLEARSAPGPAVLTEALQRSLASPIHLQMQHGLQYEYLDAEVLEVIAAILERAGQPVSEWLADRLIAHHGIRPEGTDLTSPPFYLWEPVARFYPDFLNYRDITSRALYRAPWPESSFCLVCDGLRDVELRVTARLPAVPGAPNGGREGQVALSVNKTIVGSVQIAERWSRGELRIPQGMLSAGLNRLILHWPGLPSTGEAPLEESIRRLETGVEADLHPIFGELFSLVARPV